MTETTKQRQHHRSVFERPADTEYRVLTEDARWAFGDWLGDIAWDHYATFTFPAQPSQELAIRQSKALIRRLEQRAQRPVNWFYVVERGQQGTRHVHMLLSGTGELEDREVSAAWARGRRKVERFNRSLGAQYYVTKLIGNDIIEYDIDQRCQVPTQPSHASIVSSPNHA